MHFDATRAPNVQWDFRHWYGMQAVRDSIPGKVMGREQQAPKIYMTVARPIQNFYNNSQKHDS